MLSKGSRKRYNKYKYLLYIAPAFLIWFIFALIPNIDIFRLQFYKWNGVSPEKTFVGLDNFRVFANDPNVPQAITNTIIYVLFLCIVQTVLALGIAMALKKNTRINRAFRTFVFSPVVISSILVAIIWSYMFDPNLGVINTLLTNIGLENLALNWLGTPILGICCIAFVHMWHNLGYAVLFYLAGLQTIPDELYEAAAVSGANSVQAFFKVTLPLLAPTLTRVMLLTISTAAIAFDYVYALAGSMAISEFDTLSVYMFRKISGSGSNFGLSAMVGSLIAMVVFITFIIQHFVTKRFENAR